MAAQKVLQCCRAAGLAGWQGEGCLRPSSRAERREHFPYVRLGRPIAKRLLRSRPAAYAQDAHSGQGPRGLPNPQRPRFGAVRQVSGPSVHRQCTTSLLRCQLTAYTVRSPLRLSMAVCSPSCKFMVCFVWCAGLRRRQGVRCDGHLADARLNHPRPPTRQPDHDTTAICTGRQHSFGPCPHRTTSALSWVAICHRGEGLFLPASPAASAPNSSSSRLRSAVVRGVCVRRC
jgi:hypothetical protein